MLQRRVPAAALLALLFCFGGCDRESSPRLAVSESREQALLELDAPTLANEIAAGRLSAERVTLAALDRIRAIDDEGPAVNAIIEINPDAVEIARELDRRFAEQGPVGPLHGLPVVLKANIDTGDDMATSAGSLALADYHAAVDADLVAQLRDSGAVILAKANLSEWANFRSLRSISGWSSLGGQTRNPYVLDRNPCGSSSGSAVAVAARLAPLAVGTETVGSIVCPAGANGVVGIKPTLGLVSQRGIVPLASSHDTAGPMARTVRGAALLLGAMQTTSAVGLRGDVLAVDVGDAAGKRSNLLGLRIGVVRDYSGAGDHPEVEAAFAVWLQMLREAGAELVDPVKLDLPAAFNAAVLEVLLYEFKAGIEQYLAAAHVEPGTLEALIRFNETNAADVMPHFGQELFVMARARGGLDEPAYRQALAASRGVMRARLEQLFRANDLDALMAPVNAPAWTTDRIRGDRGTLSSSSIAAVSGYPSIAVPAGLIENLPVGVAFVGPPWSEALLVEIATVFERMRGPMPAPTFIPSVER